MSILAGEPHRLNPIVLDKLLGHQPRQLNKIARIYQREEFKSARREALTLWGELLTSSACGSERFTPGARTQHRPLGRANAAQIEKCAAAMAGRRPSRNGAREVRLAMVSNGHYADAEALRLLVRTRGEEFARLKGLAGSSNTGSLPTSTRRRWLVATSSTSSCAAS